MRKYVTEPRHPAGKPNPQPIVDAGIVLRSQWNTAQVFPHSDAINGNRNIKYELIVSIAMRSPRNRNRSLRCRNSPGLDSCEKLFVLQRLARQDPQR